MTFNNRLDFGRIGEDIVEEYLLNDGWSVIPIVPRPGVGQKVYRKNGKNYPAPDFIVFKTDEITSWVEVKHKSTFGEFNGNYTLGIEISYFKSYRRVGKISKMPVYLFFVVDTENGHRIFYQSLTYLSKNIHSYTEEFYFWDYENLREVFDE